MPAQPIRVLIVDDSIFMRSVLKNALAKAEGIEVIGTAQNGIEGVQKIMALKPDVVTLDIEMPGLTGLEVLEQVMKQRPTPIVVVSTKTQKGARTTVEALQRGAIDVVAKPLAEAGARIETFSENVVTAVRGAAAANRKSLGAPPAPAHPKRPPAPVDVPLDAVVAIGISAGGPQTLHSLMPMFPARYPPIVITQHMPADFTRAFAERLNESCSLEVKEAEEGDELKAGRVLIAPGDFHLRIVARHPRLVCTLSNGPKVSGFRPSVDAMFDSLASVAAPKTVAIVMTGMGFDGAAGVKRLKAAGALTLAQDAATSIVYGMPKAAAETGCIDQVVALQDIPTAITESLRQLHAMT